MKSSSSPNGEDSRPASGQSFIRQSVDRSFGQSILRKANNQQQSMKSVRTSDYVDRDEDAASQNSFSRQSTAGGRNHSMTITSQGHGVDNNDFFADVENNGGQSRQLKSGSKSSLFSYKLADSPSRAPQNNEE